MAAKIENINEVMESAFQLEGNEAEWLMGVLHASIPLFPQGQELVACIFDANSRGEIELTTQASSSSLDITRIILEVSARLLRRKELNSTPVRVGQLALSEFVIEVADMWGLLRKMGIKDCLFLWSMNLQGSIFVICSLITDEIDPSELKLNPREFRAWEQLLAFFDVGLRLQRALRNKLVWLQKAASSAEFPWLDDWDPKNSSPKDVLRTLVLHLEQMKKDRLVTDAEEAKMYFQSLLTGAWSMVDSFQTQTRQYFIARRNEDGLRDPRGLSETEHKVAVLAARGYPNKHIAFELGMTSSTVATHLANILLKRGTISRLNLVEWMKNLIVSVDLHVLWLKISGDHYNVLTYRRRKLRHLSQLSPGVLDVLHYILQGKSNLEIAKLRGTSPRTVANQVAALFRKYNVSSRAELVARLVSNRSTLRRYPTL